jgi:hypothetical protein
LDLLGFCKEFAECQKSKASAAPVEEEEEDPEQTVKTLHSPLKTTEGSPHPSSFKSDEIVPTIQKVVVESTPSRPPSLVRQTAILALSTEKETSREVSPLENSPPPPHHRPSTSVVVPPLQIQTDAIPSAASSSSTLPTPMTSARSPNWNHNASSKSSINLSKSSVNMKKSGSFNFNPQQSGSVSHFVQGYNKIAQDLREALLKQVRDLGVSCLEIVKDIFAKIDGNDSGAVTSQEMVSFLKLPELHLFVGEEHNLERFCTMLLEQIDENG